MLQVYRPDSPIHWNWIVVQGPDAADFLHRLTTIHVKAMRPGDGSPGFFLTAQGKMRAYFHLWRISPEEFFFELDGGASGRWKQELLSVIEQFHFGEKLSVESGESSRKSAWIFTDGPFQELQPKHYSQSAEGLSFFHHGQSDFGKNWITVWGEDKTLTSWLDSLAAQGLSREFLFEDTERLRISATRPRIDAELSENTIPLEVGLRDAVSDNKGCYPGQEVIERIISLGSPARRLSKFEGSGTPPPVGEVIVGILAPGASGAAQEIGQITSVQQTGDHFEALAFVKKMHAKEGLEVSFKSNPASRAKLVTIAPFV